MAKTLADRLKNRGVDIMKAVVPPTIADFDMGGVHWIVASAYLPPNEREMAAHLVVYYDGGDANVDSLDDRWVVALRVQPPDRDAYLTQGDYDLTFAEAMTRFSERLQRQG